MRNKGEEKIRWKPRWISSGNRMGKNKQRNTEFNTVSAPQRCTRILYNIVSCSPTYTRVPYVHRVCGRFYERHELLWILSSHCLFAFSPSIFQLPPGPWTPSFQHAHPKSYRMLGDRFSMSARSVPSHINDLIKLYQWFKRPLSGEREAKKKRVKIQIQENPPFSAIGAG